MNGNFPHPSRRGAWRRAAIVVLVLGLVLAGCSGKKKVGEGVNLSVSPSPSQSAPSPSVQPTRSSPAPTQAGTQTIRPPDTKYHVHIKGGQCGLGLCGYDPEVFDVSLGTIVIIHNHDTERERSWIASDGSFDSGPIQPRKEYRYKTIKRGRFPFKDGTAFYIQGEMRVQ